MWNEEVPPLKLIFGNTLYDLNNSHFCFKLIYWSLEILRFLEK